MGGAGVNRICYLFFEAPECGVGLQARFGEGGVQSGVGSGGVASSSVDGGGVRSGGGGGVFTSCWMAVSIRGGVHGRSDGGGVRAGVGGGGVVRSGWRAGGCVRVGCDCVGLLFDYLFFPEIYNLLGCWA